jgi:hypothetical protein
MGEFTIKKEKEYFENLNECNWKEKKTHILKTKINQYILQNNQISNFVYNEKQLKTLNQYTKYSRKGIKIRCTFPTLVSFLS